MDPNDLVYFIVELLPAPSSSFLELLFQMMASGNKSKFSCGDESGTTHSCVFDTILYYPPTNNELIRGHDLKMRRSFLGCAVCGLFCREFFLVLFTSSGRLLRLSPFLLVLFLSQATTVTTRGLVGVWFC